MKITNKNVNIYINVLAIVILWVLPDMIGLWDMWPNTDELSIKYNRLSTGQLLYYMCKLVSFVGMLVLFFMFLEEFLKKCNNGEIKFEIDLLSIFKRRTQSPEEQDRKKK
jgi:hypothetical protein